MSETAPPAPPLPRRWSRLLGESLIPTRLGADTEPEDLTEAGWILGPVLREAPVFREASPPAGWVRRITERGQRIVLADALGRDRAKIFYDVTDPDRTYLGLVTLYGYLQSCLSTGIPPHLDEHWATKEKVLPALDRLRRDWAAEVRVSESQDEDGRAEMYRDRLAAIDKLAEGLSDCPGCECCTLQLCKGAVAAGGSCLNRLAEAAPAVRTAVAVCPCAPHPTYAPYSSFSGGDQVPAALGTALAGEQEDVRD